MTHLFFDKFQSCFSLVWQVTFSLLFLIYSSFFSESLSARRIGLLLATNYTGNQAGIPQLKLCEKDAHLIKNHLEKAGKFDSVEVLLGKMVTAKNVGKKISKLIKTVKKNDTVVIYFSGHGTFQKDVSAPNGLRNFLLMYKRPHLPDNLLDKWVRKIKTKKLVWIFDCCYSGGIASKGKKTRGNGSLPITVGQVGKVIEDGDKNLYFGNKAIIGSSSSNETAIEIGRPIENGIFTYYFSQSLDPEKGDLNQDGTVTLLEAFEWTRPRVVEAAHKYKHKQNPILGGNASGIYLTGREIPKPPPSATKLPPAPKKQKPPKPALSTPVPNPIYPVNPVGVSEPPVASHKNRGDVIIYTTIYKSIVAGPTPTDPIKLSARNKRANKMRNVSVTISKHTYPIQLSWLSAKELRQESGEQVPLGVYSHRSKVYKNKVAKIIVKNVPTGVHEIMLKADGYPIIKKRMGVEKEAKRNRLFVVASLAGYGTIRGKVFFKTFDRPLPKQKIYMPTITQTNQIHSMVSTSDGSFWFLNLPPGRNHYFIKASFAENLPLDNKKLTVQANTTTKVDIVLNRKGSLL